jgi:hypothetical protein
MISQPIPASAQYRVNVEKWFNYISKVVTNESDIKKIEDEIALGQIEEVISMAKDELELVDYYIEQKGWEAVAEEQKVSDNMIGRMSDSIYFSNPRPEPEAVEEKK